MTQSAAVFYSSVGNTLTRYEIDVDQATLTRRETVPLPANGMYAWPHPSKRCLYVSASPRGPGAEAGQPHSVCAFRVDRAGVLTPHGDVVRLPHRPIHTTVDATGRFLLNAYCDPSTLTVHRIENDGTIGAEVAQPSNLDGGIYAHQVRMTPSNDAVILVTRGNDAKAGKPEDPGALKVFSFSDGVLANKASIAPHGGLGFGPRHLDFHPQKPWVYVSLERQDKLELFTMQGDALSATSAFSKNLLEKPQNKQPRQLGGTVHVHPGGRFVYVANRADHTTEVNGRQVFAGGENSIAVFAIDAKSGEPNLVQHVDAHSIHVRTFAFDPSGRMMIAASIKGMDVRDGAGITHVPAALSVFRVGDDGTLAFVRKYDVETGGRVQFWTGIVELPE
jgi:6-phosphogluconolactonase (cycloisomerase 2 family)